MVSDLAELEVAIDTIHRERCLLAEERAAFVQFREAVRLADPATDGATKVTSELCDSYRETVMATPDYEASYGDSLRESLAEELSPAIADSLTTAEPFDPRLKRNVLVACSRCIDRRDRFDETLQEEVEFLESALEELRSVHATAEELPECTLDRRSLETLLDIWEAYDELEDRCTDLLADRQAVLSSSDRSVALRGEPHALNEYLYEDLESQFPVLSAIAATVDRIEDARRTEGTPRPPLASDGEGR